MGRKHSRQLLLDTTAVVYRLHGHTLQQAAVREAVAGGDVLVPVFVRMEYLRGVILNLIEMWCLIRESVTVEDAFIAHVLARGHRERWGSEPLPLTA